MRPLWWKSRMVAVSATAPIFATERVPGLNGTVFFVLSVIFMMANVVVLLRTYHRSSHPSSNLKFAVGLGLFILGQLTVNTVLVIIASLTLAVVPDAGVVLPTVIGTALAAAWLVTGLYWGYGWTFSRLRGGA